MLEIVYVSSATLAKSLTVVESGQGNDSMSLKLAQVLSADDMEPVLNDMYENPAAEDCNCDTCNGRPISGRREDLKDGAAIIALAAEERRSGEEAASVKRSKPRGPTTKAMLQTVFQRLCSWHQDVYYSLPYTGLGLRAEVYNAELAALNMAALAATTYADAHPEVKNIVFFADNRAAVSTIHDPLPRSGQHYAASFAKAAHTFLDKHEQHTIEVAWCPGHRDIAGNEAADKLAKAVVELEPVGAQVTSQAHALRKSREKTIADWTAEWRAAPRTGRFAVANRIPPSLKPTAHFVALQKEREVFGRVVQCRTGHCFQGAYYEQSVPAENIDCPCGEPHQTRQHTLRECPRYDQHRNTLWKASRDVALSDILSTKKGIAALSVFLRESGTFTKTGEPRAARAAPTHENEQENYRGWDEDEEEEE